MDAKETFLQIKGYAQEYFGDERYDAVLKMFRHFGQRLLDAPASSNINFHNAYAGGWLDHIFNVILASFQLRDMIVDMGGTIDFTDEEMVFAAMFHDLAKLGTVDEPNYVVMRGVDARGKAYKYNNDIPYLTYTDRSLWLLQHFGITTTAREMKAIRMADGLFDPANKEYYFRSSPFPGHLSYVIHWADHMSTNCEKDATLRALGKEKRDDE